MSVSTIRLQRRSCQAELLAQVAKDGRRIYNTHVLFEHLTTTSARAHGISTFAIRNNTTDILKIDTKKLESLNHFYLAYPKIMNSKFTKINVDLSSRVSPPHAHSYYLIAVGVVHTD